VSADLALDEHDWHWIRDPHGDGSRWVCRRCDSPKWVELRPDPGAPVCIMDGDRMLMLRCGEVLAHYVMGV
jgi:hypothetical protein